MHEELNKLRIKKEHKAARRESSRWPWVVLVALLLGGGAFAYQKISAASVITVETVRVKAPDVSAKPTDVIALQATGYIMAAHKIELASKVIGRVEWVGVEMGDKVEKDQVIVRLEDDEYKARVAQQQGQVNSAKARLAELKAGVRPQELAAAEAQLTQAKIDFENAKRNYAHLKAAPTARSQTEIDDAEALTRTRQAQVDYAMQQVDMMREGSRKEQIAAQEATVAQLEAALSTSMIDLNNTVIRAPMAATILERNVEKGEFVTTGFVGDRGAKGYVVSIADLKDLLVELDINQNDFAKVSMGQPCWITTDAYPDRKYEGKVELISPVANRQKATIQVRVRAMNPDDYLKPDMNAMVSFLSRRDAATQAAATVPAERPPVMIPASAIRDGAVFVVENGIVQRRAVKKGMTSARDEVEISSGLRGGEQLVVRPGDKLREGDRVTVLDR
jgi:HlyD family secretion protein